MHGTTTIAAPWFATTSAAHSFMAQHFAGYVRKRETMLPLPKWESSAVHFAPRVLPWMSRPRHHRLRSRCTVSPESAVRSRLRADQVARSRGGQATRPVVDPVWKAPAEKPVEFEKQFVWVLYDHDLQDLDRLDKTEIPKELRGKRSIASRQRVYTAEEKYIVKVGNEGQFSEDKHDDLSFPGAETRDERHKYDLWPFFMENSSRSGLLHRRRVKELYLIMARIFFTNRLRFASVSRLHVFSGVGPTLGLWNSPHSRSMSIGNSSP
jgi:hypothetical protein